MSIFHSLMKFVTHGETTPTSTSGPQVDKKIQSPTSWLQKDYDILLDYLKIENGWSRERAVEFTHLVNHVLNGPYREQAIDIITETAGNIRTSQNETTLAIIRVKNVR